MIRQHSLEGREVQILNMLILSYCVSNMVTFEGFESPCGTHTVENKIVEGIRGNTSRDVAEEKEIQGRTA